MYSNAFRLLPLIFFAPVLAFGLLSCRSYDDVSGPQSAMPVDELMSKMRKSFDPNGVLQNAKAYYLRQKLQSEGGQTFIEMTFKFPDKSRTVTTVDGKIQSLLVYNGGKCWMIDGNGEKRQMQGEDLERFKLFNALGACANIDLKEIFEKVYVFDDDEGPEKYYRVVCIPKFKDLAPIAIYVGKDDYLTKKIVTRKAGLSYVVETKKYSLVRGVMIASETEIFYAADRERLTVVEYRLDPETEDAMFEP